MFEIIWSGWAYLLIYIGTPDGTWLAVQFEKAQQQVDKPTKESGDIDTLEAQNFGFCLLPAL